jgi:hypothetical protein
MAMSGVGVGLGDFIALPQFALRVYQVCRDAPEDFWDLSAQVHSLSLLLQNINTTLANISIDETTKALGKLLLRESEATLKEVETKMNKFRTETPNRLGKRDLLRWVVDNLGAVRIRMQGNAIGLTAYLQNLTL